MLNFICSPIGNLNDISMRSISLLEVADFIYAEDTRNTNKLAYSMKINKKSKSFHEHNEIKITPAIIEQLNAGFEIAIISDAGAPCISDPGYFLSQECIKNNIECFSLKNSKVIKAIKASSEFAFAFEGFIPRKSKQKTDFFHSLKHEKNTMIFFESAKRLENTFAEYLSLNRKVILCREMTKKYEETIRAL